MNAASQVRRTRALLQVTAVFSALLWAAVAVCVVLTCAHVGQRWLSVDLGDVTVQRAAALLAGLAVALVAWRARFTRSLRRVAVWIEERVPGLDYALVTASDPTVVGDVAPLERGIQAARLDTLVPRALMHALRWPVTAVALSVVTLVAAGSLGANRVRIATHDVLSHVGIETPLPNRLLDLTVRIVPPSYSGRDAVELDDPSGVTALVGSTVTVSGAGSKNGLAASVGHDSTHVGGDDSNWHTKFAIGATPTTVTLSDRSYSRVLAVIPVADAPPNVTMLAPTRDTVWRTVPTASLTFAARATDDVGLASGYFEYTVTTGSGEIFKARTATFGRVGFGRATDGSLHATLPLAQLGLVEGALLSVRAIVSDDNTLSGPGTSTSDTRTFRVARADEFDSLAVDAAPPPPMEKSLLTERILIISAESLLKKKPSLDPKTYLSAGGKIGFDQADLRKRVYDILYQQNEAGAAGQGVEGDDEELDPTLVINRDLKEAYDAMWDAERSLNMAEIPVAIPHMNRALRALDRARLANRLYLRGRPPRIVVNVERVRLTGKDKGASNVVSVPRSRSDSIAARLDAELSRTLSLAATDATGFVNGLIRLRAEASVVSPAFAAALGDAADAARKGTDATPSLVRARRALSGAPVSGTPSLPWSGAWSGVR